MSPHWERLTFSVKTPHVYSDPLQDDSGLDRQPVLGNPRRSRGCASPPGTEYGRRPARDLLSLLRPPQLQLRPCFPSLSWGVEARSVAFWRFLQPDAGLEFLEVVNGRQA